jgi:dolichyl-phosphate beta-glucosyltransferase
MTPQISVIIPAYNEESRLPATLDSVYQYLSQRYPEFEILVVDDGSLDRTVDIVESYAKTHPRVRVLSYQPNQGKGHAIRTGILSASGELLLINDADGSSPIEEVERLEAAIRSGANIAIGSRAKPDQNRRVEALAYRKFVGNTFNAIVQKLLLPGIYDTQCGFKLFEAKVGRDLFSVATINGFGFDVEILYIARLRGYKISEIAINWHNVEGSKVNVLIDSPKMLLDVLTITFSGLFGKYKQLPMAQQLSMDNLQDSNVLSNK